MQYQTIDLTQLKPASVNVRKIGGKNVADLVPSIRSLGLLQPLLVRPNFPKNQGGFEIVAGQRRYHALCKIAEDTTIDPVPCVVMEDGDDAKAIEASLAENIARLPMDEIDQYKAFAALVKQGKDAAEIANQFGITERLVKQRLAIANLISAILTAYRKEEIDPQTLRLLTMATKKQQKAWLALFNSEDEYAPEGYRLKCWLFGGAEIATDAALFDLDEYKGGIISDLFGEARYFDDADKFWECQSAAIAKIRDDYLADGWAEVIVPDIGEYFSSWEYVETAKEDGGKVYIHVANDGEVTAHEGQLPQKEAKARLKRAESGDSDTAKSDKPELTQAMQSYLDLHRHAAIRTALLGHSGIALRLVVAQIIAGSELWTVHADPQKAGSEAVKDSLAANKAEAPFGEERARILALLDMKANDSETVVPRKQDWSVSHDVHAIFARLLNLGDDDVTAILTFITAETLPCGSGIVEALGNLLDVDMTESRQPDETFFALFRDKQAINAMLKEVAGKATADAHVASTAKVQKGIISDCLSGVRKAPKDGWTPRYMRFPMNGYTKRGGIRAINEWKAIKSLYR